MQDDVVTVMWGEFGRTPKVNSNAGRDHWSPAMSALWRAGGLRMGQGRRRDEREGRAPEGPPLHGAESDEYALSRHRYRPRHDVPQRQRPPMYVLDDREPVKELV